MRKGLDALAPRTRRAVWAVLAVVLVAVVAIAAVVMARDPAQDSASEPAAPAARPANPYEQARTLGVTLTLQAYTDALRAADPTKALAQLDPSADAALRTQTELSAAGVRDLPLTTFEYRLADSRDFERRVPSRIQDTLDAAGSADSWVAPVQLRYAYAGIDPKVVVVDIPMVMAQYADGWRIVAEAAPLFGDAPAPGQVWQFPIPAAQKVVTGPGESLVLTNGSDRRFADEIAGELPRAVTSVSRFWGTKWPQSVGVIAADTDEEFRSITGAGESDAEAAAAVTVFTEIERPDGAAPTAIGQRVVFTPQAAQLDSGELGVVLRHEVFHVAARAVTAENAATWVTEGVAEYVGRSGTYTELSQAAPALAQEVATSGPPADLPSDADFSPSNPDAAVSYQSAWSVAAFVAETFGPDKLRNFYVALAGADQPVDPALVVAAQDTASAVVLGISREELVRQWRDWLSAQIR